MPTALSAKKKIMQQVFIVAAVRTPLGSFGGSLSSVPAPQLGAAAIRGALAKANVAAEAVNEVFMGNVVSANLGQAPARQAANFAGIPHNVPCTTINKVCASGMKSIMLGAQSIMLGHNDIVVAGGMENMSLAPFYVPNARWGYKYGHSTLVDGLAKDGLDDAYEHCAMGIYSDRTSEKYHISREEQDAFTVDSYKRSAASTEAGIFQAEIVPVEVPQRKGSPVVVREDEEFRKVVYEKIPSLRPAFSKNGTATAANSSTINDGASALVLVGEKKLKELNLKPLARIVSFADAEQEPAWFTTTPTIATPKALERAGLKKEDIDFFEINEAFSTVPLAFEKIMGVSHERMNVLGGAVALGHPLGASGARIVTTLNNVLHQRNGRYGLAAICNGGGGASAIILEKF